MSKSAKQIDVWGVGGGQGTTTIAAVLASILRVRLETADRWVVESMFGGDEVAVSHPGRIVDRGVLVDESPGDQMKLIVMRGPSAVGLGTVKRLGVATTDVLIVVGEPWRTLSGAQAQQALGVSTMVETPFSQRVARRADAGLLGLRLDEMAEFDALRHWARQGSSRRTDAAPPRSLAG